jgi:hypothetical protein
MYVLGSVFISISLPERRGIHVLLIFEEEWKDRAAQLIVGQEITAIGELREVSDNSISLKNCEIVA